jgi:hypothetical protein
LLTGYRWTFLLEETGQFAILDLLYGISHIFVGLFGLFSLYFMSIKWWRIALILMAASFLQDFIFYLVAALTSPELSPTCSDRTWILTIVFFVILVNCLLRLFGLAIPGNVVGKGT